MFKPNGAARPILWTMAVVTGAFFLIQRALLAANGLTHPAAAIYSWALGGLFAASLASIALLRLGRPGAGMHVYAVASLISTIAMTHGYMSNGGTELPELRLLIPLGLVPVSLTLGWRVGRCYAAAAAAVMIGMALAYGQPNDVGLALPIVIIAIVSAQEVGKVALEAQTVKEDNKELREKADRLERDFDNLSTAIQEFTEHGKRRREAEADGGGADRSAPGRDGGPSRGAGS